MEAAGIVCEYNPFHRGHKYHIAKTRESISDCSIVCVMSGNFVQRGAAALFPKHARAEAAVRCGADLVIELPVTSSMTPAERFASDAVLLLNATGVVTHLSFGSESADLQLLCNVAEALVAGIAEEQLLEELKTGISYAAARENAVRNVVGTLGTVLKSPNDILAIEYLKALKRQKLAIEPIAIKRVGAEHDGENGKNGFLSASKIRDIIQRGECADEYMPEAAAEIFERERQNGRMIDTRAIEAFALYRMRTMAEREFEALPENSEGLHNRLMKAAKMATSAGEVLALTKSKRYTAARIRRMIMSAYLGLKAADTEKAPEYISVLAMNERGMDILAEMKKKASLPIITKPASAKKLSESAAEMYNKCAATDDLYTLAFTDKEQRTGGMAWKTGPVIVK